LIKEYFDKKQNRSISDNDNRRYNKSFVLNKKKEDEE